MRTTLFLCICLVIFPSLAFAQKNSIGAYTSFFNGGTTFGVSIGGPSLKVTGGSLAGVEYKLMLTKHLSANLGVEYSKHTLTQSSIGIGGSSVTNNGDVQYLTVPLYLRIDFLRYLFFNFGILIDAQAESALIATRKEIGVIGGIGAKYDFKNNFTIYLNPFFQQHGYPAQDKLLLSGVRVGVGYRF